MIATVTVRWKERINNEKGYRYCSADIHFDEKEGKFSIFGSIPLKVTRTAQNSIEVSALEAERHLTVVDMSEHGEEDGGSDDG